MDVPRLDTINEIDEVMIATRHTNTAVKKGDRLLGTRVIPLVIAKEKMERVKEVAGEKPLVSLTPFKPMKAGIVTTGNEVYYGRIKDTFTPVIIEKLAAYGIDVCGQILCDDNMERITDAILKLKEEGADLILCTGGMSVDPDDRTPGAIKNTGARIVSYGAPVLPGAMFLLAYFEDGTPGSWLARLCHVCQSHNLRSGSATHCGRRRDHKERTGPYGKWRLLPGM